MPLTSTHITKLTNVLYALRRREKMNAKATRLMLSEQNNKTFDKAQDLLKDVIHILEKIK